MGAIRNFVQKADDSDKVLQEANAHLDTMSALAKARVDYAIERINNSLLGAGQGTDRTLPVSEIQAHISQTHAYSSANADKISKTVSSALQDFIQPDQDREKGVLDGVSKLASAGITALFGSSSATEDTYEDYHIALDGLSLIRLDIFGWKRVVESESLKKRVEQISAFVIYKSTVATSQAKFDTFLDKYQSVIKHDHPDWDIGKMIEEGKNLFKEFGGSVD